MANPFSMRALAAALPSLRSIPKATTHTIAPRISSPNFLSTQSLSHDVQPLDARKPDVTLTLGPLGSSRAFSTDTSAAPGTLPHPLLSADVPAASPLAALSDGEKQKLLDSVSMLLERLYSKDLGDETKRGRTLGAKDDIPAEWKFVCHGNWGAIFHYGGGEGTGSEKGAVSGLSGLCLKVPALRNPGKEWAAYSKSLQLAVKENCVLADEAAAAALFAETGLHGESTMLPPQAVFSFGNPLTPENLECGYFETQFAVLYPFLDGSRYVPLTHILVGDFQLAEGAGDKKLAAQAEALRSEPRKRLFELTVPILREVLENIERMETVGIMHKDVKPDNIMVDYTASAAASSAGTAASSDSASRSLLVDLALLERFQSEQREDNKPLTFKVMTVPYNAPFRAHPETQLAETDHLGHYRCPKDDVLSAGLTAIEVLLGPDLNQPGAADELENSVFLGFRGVFEDVELAKTGKQLGFVKRLAVGMAPALRNQAGFESEAGMNFGLLMRNFEKVLTPSEKGWPTAASKKQDYHFPVFILFGRALVEANMGDLGAGAEARSEAITALRKLITEDLKTTTTNHSLGVLFKNLGSAEKAAAALNLEKLKDAEIENMQCPGEAWLRVSCGRRYGELESAARSLVETVIYPMLRLDKERRMGVKEALRALAEWEKKFG